MDRLKIAPELNFWMSTVLHNSPLNEYFFKVPVEIDYATWKSPHSLLDLLFNETFEPRELEGSSSSSLWDSYDGFRFSWGFRKADLTKITDKNVLRRLTIYAGNVDVYVANIPENEYMFATYKYTDIPGPVSTLNPTTEELYKAYSEVNPGIVSAVCAPYRASLTPYQQELLGEYYPPENIFDITDQEVGMLEKLYEYKSELPVTINDVDYDDLTDCLAKLVYIYLDWELNESFSHYNSAIPITDGSRLICSQYEKHVLDHLYRVISKSYNMTYTQDRVDELIPLEHDFMRVQLTQVQVDDKQIILPSDEIPYDGNDFYLVHNGFKKDYGKDYLLQMIRPYETNQEIVETSIRWNHDDFHVDDEIYVLWSFLAPESLSESLDNLNTD